MSNTNPTTTAGQLKVGQKAKLACNNSLCTITRIERNGNTVQVDYTTENTARQTGFQAGDKIRL